MSETKNVVISQVLDALEGRVIFVLGNHDITATAEDLHEIGSSNHKVQFKDNFHIKDGVVYTHGHLYTLFNAPDISTNPSQPLPVGHFVTRAVSYLLKVSGE
ncbi:MAG: metallophosphoesterase superfamily enzyme [Saprospiraceae bacterium]|jgi:metallophosphoesterase superfamily enzyme